MTDAIKQRFRLDLLTPELSRRYATPLLTTDLFPLLTNIFSLRQNDADQLVARVRKR